MKSSDDLADITLSDIEDGDDEEGEEHEGVGGDPGEQQTKGDLNLNYFGLNDNSIGMHGCQQVYNCIPVVLY